jgi:hypothetical protein
LRESFLDRAREIGDIATEGETITEIQFLRDGLDKELSKVLDRLPESTTGMPPIVAYSVVSRADDPFWLASWKSTVKDAEETFYEIDKCLSDLQGFAVILPKVEREAELGNVKALRQRREDLRSSVKAQVNNPFIVEFLMPIGRNASQRGHKLPKNLEDDAFDADDQLSKVVQSVRQLKSDADDERRAIRRKLNEDRSRYEELSEVFTVLSYAIVAIGIGLSVTGQIVGKPGEAPEIKL